MSTTIISLTLYKQNQRKIRFTFVIIVDKSDKFFFPFTTFHRCRLRASVQKLESHSEMKLFPQTLKNLFGCLCCLTKTVFCSVFHAGFHVCTENFPHEKKEPTHNRKRKNESYRGFAISALLCCWLFLCRRRYVRGVRG